MADKADGSIVLTQLMTNDCIQSFGNFPVFHRELHMVVRTSMILSLVRISCVGMLSMSVIYQSLVS